MKEKKRNSGGGGGGDHMKHSDSPSEYSPGGSSENKFGNSTPGANEMKKKIRRGVNSEFDINNVVLPNMGGVVQIRKIEYKEILTPNFREILEGQEYELPSDESSADENTDDDFYVNLHLPKEADEHHRFSFPSPQKRKLNKLSKSSNTLHFTSGELNISMSPIMNTNPTSISLSHSSPVIPTLTSPTYSENGNSMDFSSSSDLSLGQSQESKSRGTRKGKRRRGSRKLKFSSTKNLKSKARQRTTSPVIPSLNLQSKLVVPSSMDFEVEDISTEDEEIPSSPETDPGSPSPPPSPTMLPPPMKKRKKENENWQWIGVENPTGNDSVIIIRKELVL